jgi:hypothetical protein
MLLAEFVAMRDALGYAHHVRGGRVVDAENMKSVLDYLEALNLKMTRLELRTDSIFKAVQRVEEDSSLTSKRVEALCAKLLAPSECKALGVRSDPIVGDLE